MKWKVYKEIIKVFPHHNADKLGIMKIGDYQAVFNKESRNFITGDTVIFIPEKSILPENLQAPWKDFLHGPLKNRVGNVTLRGELSQGIVVTLSEASKILDEANVNVSVLFDANYGEDISHLLGIAKFVPEIPKELEGKCVPLKDYDYYKKHDVLMYSVYEDNFEENEEIIATEKLNGRQVNNYFCVDGSVSLSSKGLANDWIEIIDSPDINFWEAYHNTFDSLQDNIKEELKKGDIQIFSEMIPSQKGFTYGQSRLSLRVFRYRQNGKTINYDNIPQFIKNIFVPIIYKGQLKKYEIRKLAEGKEQVSGKELHIKEGIVISPKEERKASDGNDLYLKILNSKYKDVGDEES